MSVPPYRVLRHRDFRSAAIGATVSVVSGGVATVLLAAVVGLAAPVVRDYVQPTAPPSA